MMGRSSFANERVMRSSSASLYSAGSISMPPFPPPYGMFTSAHLYTIHPESAFTSARVTPGW